ncbi:ATP-binding protein [Floridanema evergladense]|uniref:histidine kinase n=1 Tax=Floridaenema evergladense BLCC-F167 TaxID=3153639 RepID=A0ABV4WE86_9CYAN
MVTIWIMLFHQALMQYLVLYIIGKHLSQVLPLELAERHLNFIKKALLTKELQVFEQEFEVNGKVLCEEVRISVVGANEVLLIVRDISDRKRIEKERQRAENALAKAKEAAEIANKTKSEFLANMSHELRTPLNAILGFTQVIMQDCSLENSASEYLEIINRSGQHLLNLINDVLEMSKIEAGRTSLNTTDFNLHDLLNSLEKMLRLKAESKRLQLIFDCDPNVPKYVKTDEGKLRQVLINLLGNAIKFTSQGGVILRVKGREKDPIPQSHSTLYFEVEDTGIGIEPEEVELLFEPFVQKQNTPNTQEGTGLGLPISRKFVQLMGGDIRVDSVPGKGTLVQFEVQVELATSANQDSQVFSQKVIGLVPGQTHYRILVVEDNRENRQLLMTLLRSLQFEVQEAINGQEALFLWQTWHPDLIWMDMRMPVMDGYEATRQIRAIEKTLVTTFPPQPTKIIALTASAFKEDRVKVLATGCDDFVSKPFRQNIILQKMTQHLGVQYIYAQETEIKINAATSSKSFDPTFASKSLEEMPKQWIEKVKIAAMTGSDEELYQLIEEIPAAHPELTDILNNWVINFQFDNLLNFIQTKDKKTEKQRGKNIS